MNQCPPSDDDLQAFVDDALEDERRRAVEAWLAGDPELAARVGAWRLDAEALRRDLAGAVARPLPPHLDPSVVRHRLRARARGRGLLAAALLLCLAVGGVGGWQARRLSTRAAPMADAVEAYRVFATDGYRPVEMDAAHAALMQQWLSARLGRPTTLPDLHADGFALLGGRLLSTPDGPAAMILYQDKQGQRVSLYIRQSERFPAGTHGSRRDGGLLTHYWYRNGYGFAVVARADDPRTPEVQQAIHAAS